MIPLITPVYDDVDPEPTLTLPSIDCVTAIPAASPDVLDKVRILTSSLHQLCKLVDC